MKATKRLLRRLGLLAYEPYVCRVCGYSVSDTGTRYAQAGVAYNHWQENHDA